MEQQRSYTQAGRKLPPPPPTAVKPKMIRSKSTSVDVRTPGGTAGLSSMRSSSIISDSSIFEEENSSEGNQLRSFSNSVSSAGSETTNGECQKHPHERLKYYCQFHDVLVCADCLAMDAKHQGHKHIRAEEMVKDYRSNLKAQISPLEELQEKAQAATIGMDQRMKELLGNGTTVKEAIKVQVAKLIAILESRQTAMLEEADRIVSHKMKQHNAHQAYLENIIAEITRLVDSASAIANDNSTNILYCYKELSINILETTRKFQSLPNEVFLPLQGPNISFSQDYTVEEVCQTIGTISERQADPMQSFFDEATTKGLTVNKEAIVQLIINDGEGKPYSDHVPGLNVEVVNTATNSSLDFNFEQDKSSKNQYNIGFTPRDGCEHIVKARIGSNPLQNSPIVTTVSTIIEGEIVGEIKGVLQPYGLALTEHNDIIIVENGKDCVSIYNQDGKTMKHRTITGKGNKKLTRPRGAIVRPNNHLLISDEEGLKVCTMEGKQMNIIGKQGNGDLEFNTPTGMTTSTDGMVYVCDTFNSRIQILDQELNFYGYMGNDGPPGALNAPYDIAINSSNTFYVADYSDSAIKMFSKRGEFLGQIEVKENNERLKNPVSVHVNKKDHVFVGEEKGTGVSVFDANGKFLMTIPIKLSGCYGISSDRDGLLYLCDRANRRIIIYK